MVNPKKDILSIWDTRNSDPANVEAVAAEPDYRRPCFSPILLVAVVAALHSKGSEAVAKLLENMVPLTQTEMTSPPHEPEFGSGRHE